MSARILVVGSGIVGLSSALRLREAGYHPEIVTRDLPAATTSAAAAAFWYPFKVSGDTNVVRWSQQTFREYEKQIARGVPGVKMSRFRELYDSTPPDPWWREIVGDVSTIPGSELAGFECAYQYMVPFTDTPLYLPWLESQVRSAGIPIRLSELTSLQNRETGYELIVNCTGVWAAELVSDAAVKPIRGQVQLVSAIVSENPEIIVHLGPKEVTYIVRRSGDCVMGGTIDEGNWSLTPDVEVARKIRERCERLEPQLRSARVIKDVVGLRPGRSSVRLELEPASDGRPPIIHNYGHGGAGFTLCWGCADAVVALARLC